MSPLKPRCSSLLQDPKVQEAKRLLLEAVDAHTKHLQGPRPPDPSREKGYQELLETFAKDRGGNLWYPYLGSGLGRGALVELEDGSVKYDMICGIGAHFGHHHPLIVSATFDAALADIAMQGNLQQNADSAKLCHHLVELSGLDHCFLSTSGVMACENGWKVLMQHRAPASRILAFEKCFMGRTLAMSQVTDKAAYREGLPTSLQVDYVPFYDAARPESLKESLQRLEQHLLRYPGQHAGMAFELIQGEAGYFSAPREFFTTLMDKLQEHHIPIFVDEVQSFGRTSSLFAFQHFGLEKYVDVVTVGKLLPACATLFRTKYKPKAGLLSQTFTASTSAIHVSLAILKEMLSGGYLGERGKIMELRRHFVGHLEAIAKRHPHLMQGPFGVGAMIACTLFGGEKKRVDKFLQALFQAGVIAFSAGSHPVRVRFLMPLGSISYEDLNAIAGIVEKTLLACAKE